MCHTAKTHLKEQNSVLCGLGTEGCMATTPNSHFRSLMWYDGGNLLQLCHSRNILYMIATSLMVSHYIKANIANTSVIKEQAA